MKVTAAGGHGDYMPTNVPHIICISSVFPYIRFFSFSCIKMQCRYRVCAYKSHPMNLPINLISNGNWWVFLFRRKKKKRNKNRVIEHSSQSKRNIRAKACGCAWSCVAVHRQIPFKSAFKCKIKATHFLTANKIENQMIPYIQIANYEIYARLQWAIKINMDKAGWRPQQSFNFMQTSWLRYLFGGFAIKNIIFCLSKNSFVKKEKTI